MSDELVNLVAGMVSWLIIIVVVLAMVFGILFSVYVNTSENCTQAGIILNKEIRMSGFPRTRCEIFVNDEWVLLSSYLHVMKSVP